MTALNRDTRPVVLLDIDDTILDFGKAERVAVSATFARLGIEADEPMLRRYSEINRRLWEQLEDGKLSREQVLHGRFTQLFGELGIEASPRQAKELYEALLAEGHYFMPGAEEMLKALYGEYRLFICSNGSGKVQAGRIKSAGIAPYFERIFISEELGCDKPSAEYFEACFRMIPELCRERTIMVGDSLTSDIRGGRNAGILTCWYNPKRKSAPEALSPDYEIEELEGLKALLERIFTKSDEAEKEE